MKLFLKKSWPFLLLAVLSLTIHFAFLSYPAQVVFDEVHFGKFVVAYFTHEYYFDIHPPLGKLMIAGVAKLANINLAFVPASDQNSLALHLGFEKIGESAPAGVLFWLRFLPAFFGSLFSLFFAWLAYLISRSKKIALVAGFLILLDNAFLIQSKFILVDIFMLTFEVLTLCFFFLWQRQKIYSRKWLFYLLATAIFFGLTISIKWTGLATFGIIGLILLAKTLNSKAHRYLSPQNEFFRWLNFKEAFFGLSALFLIGGAVYLAPFYVHFQLLNLPGPGSYFMSQVFQEELKYGRENVYRPLSFAEKVIELNQTMLFASADLDVFHPFGSRWYGWAINHKPVYYWNQDVIAGLPGWKAKIYFSGNFFLWWLGAFSVVIIVIKSLTKKSRQKISPILYFLIIGYLANLLPFILIKRVAFLYHYLPPAIYANLLCAFLIADFWPQNKKVLIGFFGLAALVFFVLLPLSYGWPLPPTLENFELRLMSFFN